MKIRKEKAEKNIRLQGVPPASPSPFRMKEGEGVHATFNRKSSPYSINNNW